MSAALAAEVWVVIGIVVVIAAMASLVWRARHPEDDCNPDDPTQHAPSWAHTADTSSGSGCGLVGMNEREEEDFFLAYGTRKQRKAIRARRKAREQAQKQGPLN